MKNVTPTEALNSLYPLPCFIISTVDENGKLFGMTASWVFQTSFEPPMIAISMNKVSYTREIILRSKEFVVSVPNKDLEKTVLYFGNTSGRDVDKFQKMNVKTEKAKVIKTPILAEATINFECKVVETIKTGDHTVFIGEVVAGWRDENKKVLMYMGKESGNRLFEEF